MLYIFQVDTGQMVHFDMDVAISTVTHLKSRIWQSHGIPIDKQVLLVSGGEILEPSSRVCNYAAGTDTNPIFLFNKLNIEGGGGSVGGAEPSDVADLETLQKQIEHSNGLPPTYMSVVTRAQLAQHVLDLGKDLTTRCELLIHHQHLQHQGWAAVVANLDDIVAVFQAKLAAFVSAHDKFGSECEPHQVNNFVDTVTTTLKTLDTIKIPNKTPSITSTSPPASPPTIARWLAEHYASDATASIPSLHDYVSQLASSTRKTYETVMCSSFLPQLKSDTTQVIDKACSPNMKEIKGLEERLYGLDQLLQEARKLVVDQNELTQAFHANVSRASDVRDDSIFPDLCASHQHQLVVMFKNHTQLEDIRRRCARAKEELTLNLNTRLKWIAFVQKNLSEQSGKISLYNETLKRLRVNVNVLQQIHECETVFRAYREEVQVRGRVGSRLSSLACAISRFNSIAAGENLRREGFRAQFSNHFLCQLFDKLVEDVEVDCVRVPNIVAYECDECDATRDHGDNDLDEFNENARVRELEAQVRVLKGENERLSEQLCECSRVSEARNEVVGELRRELESVQRQLDEKDASECKYTKQIAELKALINEFREKEDENIRIQNQELASHANHITELEEKCETRVRELERMLEFECGQRVKAIEDAHRLEMDALVNRFKLMNKSKYGSAGEIQCSSPVGGGGIAMTGLASPGAERGSGLICGGGGAGLGSLGAKLEGSDNEGEEMRGSLDETGLDAGLTIGGGEHGGETDERVTVSGANASSAIVQLGSRLEKLSRISTDSVRVGGDSNLFYYNASFRAFTVYLNASANRNVHFLNLSSEDDARLRNLTPTQVFIANVTDKEFCVARRPNNRYNVPQGFHFYRVKCKLVEIVLDNYDCDKS